MKPLHHVASAWALALTATASLAQAPSPVSPASSASEAASAAGPASALTPRLMYELLLSEMLAGQGQAHNGVALMLDAARRTGDAALFKRATEMALRSRSGDAALQAARAWRQAFPDSVDASRYELQVLIALGRVGESEAPLRAMLAALPDDEKVAFIHALPALYQRVPNLALAAQTVQQALAPAFKQPALAPAAWTAIGRMRLRNQDIEGALAAAVQGQAADARSEWPAVLALQILADDARQDRAQALLDRYLAQPEAQPQVRLGYARLLIEQGLFAQAHEQLNALIQRQPEYAEAWLTRGALYADERNIPQAEADLRHYLSLSNPPEQLAGADQARMILARLAERRGDYAEAERWLASITSAEQALNVQTRRAHMLARQGQLEQARQAIRSTPEGGPEDARQKLLAEAQLLRDHQQPAQAYALLTEALAQDPDDERLLYDAAMVAERLDRMDEMERLMRRVIALNPQAAHAYNALGYSLADRNLRLPEAKRLIEQALQLSPDDGFIQDSLGWVLFRMGDLDQAQRVLQAAYKRQPDPEIAAHLGEVLWLRGDQDGARQVWRDGLRLEQDNETLRKTLERFQVQP